MTNRRNCTWAGTEPRLSTSTGGRDRRLPKAMLPHLILGALFLSLLGGALQPYAWAQAGSATGPQGAPRPQGQNPNGMHIYIWSGLKSHGVGQHDYPQFLADRSEEHTSELQS